MEQADYEAYQCKRDQERPEREALNQRYASAMDWLETNCNTLTHWRRFVLHVEEIITTFRAEEQRIEPCEDSCFLYELRHPHATVPWQRDTGPLAPETHE